MTLLLRPQSAVPQAQAAECETVQDILNIAATAEALAVTLLGAALANVGPNGLLLNDDAVGTLTAARAAEQAHYDVLVEAGAEASTLTFTLPDPELLTSAAAFWTMLVSLEEAFVAAYLTAAQEFALQGEVELTQIALQIGAVEAEHRVGARFFGIQTGAFSGTPNDVAFEKALFGSLSEAAVLLETLGFIGGNGTELAYPGPGEIDATGVESLRP